MHEPRFWHGLDWNWKQELVGTASGQRQGQRVRHRVRHSAMTRKIWRRDCGGGAGGRTDDVRGRRGLAGGCRGRGLAVRRGGRRDRDQLAGGRAWVWGRTKARGPQGGWVGRERPRRGLPTPASSAAGPGPWPRAVWDADEILVLPAGWAVSVPSARQLAEEDSGVEPLWHRLPLDFSLQPSARRVLHSAPVQPSLHTCRHYKTIQIKRRPAARRDPEASC